MSEATLIEAAAWLEQQHSHDLLAPMHVAFALATVPGLTATVTATALEIVTESGVSEEVVLRSARGGRKYVTVNEVGSALCRCLTGEDPGMGLLLGHSWMARVRALRGRIQKGRAT